MSTAATLLPFMPLDARIYVAGHRGLAGSALVRRLQSDGYRRLVLRDRAELDLTQASAVADFFAATRPQFVFLAAAKVGGILANSAYPADFIRINLQIQTNVIHSAYEHGVERLLFLGSTCLYPRHCEQPMKEEYLLSGPLEPTNSAYAVAKLAGIEMCRSYNQQHGTRFFCALPSNLYGPGDNYDSDDGHVLAALMRRFHEAKVTAADRVDVWGTGRPRREFMHADDMAAACVLLMNQPEQVVDRLLGASLGRHRLPAVNVGVGNDIEIIELARLIAQVVGFQGRIEFDSSRPDGVMRKLVDVSVLGGLGWKPCIDLDRGLRMTYAEFLRERSVA